jgi:manganese transport protein
LLGIGFDPTRALVDSQVLLSFGIPFALIPLVLLTRNRAVMGVHVNRRLTSAVAMTLAAVITLLNGYLIYRLFSRG